MPSVSLVEFIKSLMVVRNGIEVCLRRNIFPSSMYCSV